LDLSERVKNQVTKPPPQKKWPRLAAFGPVRDKLIDLAVERYVRISLCCDDFFRRYVLVFVWRQRQWDSLG
jgi:hypothetical protein